MLFRFFEIPNLLNSVYMKKFYLFFAAALMALVSCSDDPETPVRVPEIVVNTPQITVDAEEASTLLPTKWSIRPARAS